MRDPEPDPERDEVVVPQSWGDQAETVTVPVGWPEAVPAPGHPRFAETASAWLYDQAPGEWRDQEVLRRHPLLLARNVRYLVGGQLEAMRAAYARARVELAGYDVSPEVIEQQLQAYAAEGARLNGLVRQAQLVEDALSGTRWRPRL